MGIKQKITKKLEAAFSPEFLSVIDESDKHRGHAGWIEGTPTHFRVQISAEQLRHMSRVAQHRAIMKIVEDDFDKDLHAFAIEVIDKQAC